MRPPWSDPRFAYLVDFAPPRAAKLLDLNRGFRSFLTSPQFTREVTREVRQERRIVERRRDARGQDLWTLYRSVRLSAALACLRTDSSRRGESAEEYFHFLATGDRWSFTSRVACPHADAGDVTVAAKGGLGRVGAAFERYVVRSGLIETARRFSRVVIGVEDDGQLPFAVILVRMLKGVPTQVTCSAAVNPCLVRAFGAHGLVISERSASGSEIAPILTTDEIAGATRFFRRSPGRLLSVDWRPESARRASTIARYLATLRVHGVPVALDFAPWIDEKRSPRDELFGAVLDRLLVLAPSFADLRVRARSREISEVPLRSAFALRTRDEALSDMLQVQLVAERNDVRLAPYRERRTSLAANTRLEAARPLVVRSHFDLAAISALLDPEKDARPYRGGRGRPLADTPRFLPSARARRYLVFVGCPLVIPVSAADAGYADVLSFFARPRPLREFAARYAKDQRPRVRAFLDLLVHNDILRTA